MYYLQLDKDPGLYPGAPGPRHAGLGLSPQGFAAPQYSDFTGYHPHAHAHHAHAHHHHGLSADPLSVQQPGPGGWSPAYPPPPPRDDWSSHHYAAAGGPPSVSAGPGVVGPPLGFSPPEFSGQSGLLSTSLNASAGQLGPGSLKSTEPRLHSEPEGSDLDADATPLMQMPRGRWTFEYRSGTVVIRMSLCFTDGKTRTKDKYRVVYTDHQRLELEKEFHYSKYITIRRKAELATTLGLSERQVKIWFQNRRAKERKINKKKLQQPASSTTVATPPDGGGLLHGNGASMVTSSSGSNGMVSPSSLPMNIKEEY
ncbi:Homeobox protein CDX-1 [Liparis tanakae]|uniref:Homeobox protein CDX-1 n=1 Tax=Liparis tanakae TaxID=230148 RepID=A0A4Z2FYM8_9TELE|nr:Homeobox protein CDX-1 [Liparis tanakae]